MNMHKKYITPSQRVITCVLLFSQLLTSCGGYETLLPSNPNAHPKKTVHEHETTCPDDNQLELDTQPATFIRLAFNW